MSWIKVNVCFFFSTLMSEIWNFVFVPVKCCMYIRYICLGNEVLSIKLDVHHSDHTWWSWQSSVMRGMCEPDVNAAHWSCSIHVHLSACIYGCIYKVISAADVCSISDAEYRYDVCQAGNEWTLWLTPHTHITNHTVTVRHRSWKHSSSNTVSNRIQCLLDTIKD